MIFDFLFNLQTHRTMDNPTMDPLNMPFHVQELIFENLSGKDVLNCFLVSPSWNRIASKSPKAMSKIQLNLKRGNWYLESCRDYQNVEVSSDSCDSGVGSKQAMKSLVRHSSTLVEIRLFGLENYEPGSELREGLNFPKLKTLELSLYTENGDDFDECDSDSRFYYLQKMFDEVNSRFLDASPNIENLDLCLNYEHIEDTQLDFEKVANKSNLKILRINDFALEKLQNAKFKLQKLSLEYDFKLHIPSSNTKAFFEKMAPTLTTFELCRFYKNVFYLALSVLTNLKTLIIHNYKEFLKVEGIMQMTPLPSVRELELVRVNQEMKALITTVLPNVEMLKLHSASKSDIEWIARNMMSLKGLEIEEDHLKSQEDYQELMNFNHDIKIKSSE